MMLYVKHFAQMCNRLWALVPVLAYAIHNQLKIYVLFAKKEYVDCFPNLKENQYVRFWFCHNSNNPLPLEWRLALLSEKFGLEVKGDLRNVGHTRTLKFIDGWQHSNDISYVTEYSSEIVKMFRPDDVIVEKVDRYFKDYSGLTIGLHIRRGDYKDYLGGKYYFDDDVYLNVINKIRCQFAANGCSIRFLVCSNENTRISNYNNDIFTIQESNGVTDLYALSCCDYIIGPPSSYSQWASFYGHVPLFVLLDKNPHIHVNYFSRIVAFNCFENGRKLFLDERVGEYYIL